MAKFSFAGQTRALGKMTRRTLRLSRLALLAEGLAQALWPAFSVACFALAAALLGGFALLDPATHRIAVLAALGLFAATLLWAALRFRAPSRAAAARRLDAGDPAHPIATLGDTLSAGSGDDISRRIWFEHLRRAERAAARLRAAAPDLRLARFDRWALRMFAPVLVIAGLIGAGESWTERLGTLFAPAPGVPGAAVVKARAPMAEGWAMPPAYTGLGTVYLNKLAEAGTDIRLPQGSELIVRVTDLGAAPEIEAPGLTGFEGFTDFGGALAEARGVLEASGRIEITGGGAVLAGWDIAVVPDAPPVISMPEPPGATLAGALEVHFVARDDYGIDTAWAEIVPMGGIVPGRGLAPMPITFALPMPIAGRALEVKDSAIRDLSEHPWAGAWVEMMLYAEDGSGQRASAGPVRMRLPGRHFTHPLARALVEQRRELAMEFEQGDRVLDVLQAVTRRPDEIFSDNSGAYLVVRTAVRRLARGVADDDVSGVAPEVTEFLWLAALSLEDGDLSSALERLHAAEEALRRALESGTEEDIRRAMEELRAAMQEYIEELVRQALERGLEPGDEGQGGESRMLSQQDLEEMLDELQRRAESGLRDQARDMLSELSRMLENLQAGRQQQHGSGGERALEALQEMIQRQRDLADRTFDELRQQRRDGQRDGRTGRGERPQPGEGGPNQGDGTGPGAPGQTGSLAAEQEALRRALEELARQLPGGGGTTGQALEDAGRAMGEARDDLENRQPGDAVEDQMEALDRLDEGAQALAEALSNGQGDTANRGRGRRNGQARDLLSDPFDRPAGAFGAIDGRDTQVPDRSVLDRARQVLEELRRRAAEPYRPRIELDYLDRLMDQF
ncbi:MAG: DUF4175 domain-containing protein [Alphaproteobacteria bacterium]